MIIKRKRVAVIVIVGRGQHGETQMKCFFVGGPNVRKDYHVEEGSEFFYMVQGNMCLKVIEQNMPRDVIIKQGEVFLLPRRIPHSPQREAGTIGMVVERARAPNEIDSLRYFVEKDGKPTNEILYEEWFHCDKLGPQLSAIIGRYFASEQYKTGVPIPGTIKTPDEAPFRIDSDTTLSDPFSLEKWLEENKARLELEGCVDLFSNTTADTHVKIYGPGSFSMVAEKAEVFFWTLGGSCVVEAKDHEYKLGSEDTLWLPVNTSFTLRVADTSSRVFMLYMFPAQ